MRRSIFSPNGVSQGGRVSAGRIKREEARDQGTELLAVVWPSQTQIGE